MSFGKIVKKLRRERDMTQEQLAEILSISPQAISRWETDMAMPDISMIAPLCHLFHITSDELLEIDLAQKQKNIDAICKESDRFSQRGYLDEARKILENGMRQYPDDMNLIYNLMYLSSWQYDSTGDNKYMEESIRLGEYILGKSTEDSQRHGAIQILCYSYRNAGRIDEAVKLAESMPFMCESRESLLSGIYSGDKAYAAKQTEIFSLFQHLSNSLFFLQTKLDSGEWAYTQEESAILRDKRIELLNLFFENGDFGFYHTHLCDTHREQAIYYAKKNDEEKALKHLQSAAEHAIKFITSIDEERTSLIFRGQKSCSFTTGDSRNEAQMLIDKMESPVFDQLRNKKAFAEIKASLLEHAGKWSVE